MSRRGKLFLEDILECMEKIEQYISGLDFEGFNQNQLIIDAVVRNLEVIGEAARNVPEDVRQIDPKIPWKSMIGLRNILIHEYFGIDEQIVWQIVTVNIRDTKPLIEELLNKYEKAAE